MLILDAREVEALLDVDALIDALGPALADLGAGRASLPGRIFAAVPERQALFGDMPAYVPSTRALVSKVVSVFPGNAGTEVPVRQAVILAFDPDTGTPAALLDGTYVTAIRTGACSALATRLLAREDASTLAILGTGAQARAHAAAVTRVRQFREVRIASHDPARAAALAAELAGRLDAAVRPAASFQEAISGADVVCGATYATEPAIRREWLRPGAHVTSVGFNPRGREVDDATVAASLLFVDSRREALTTEPRNRDLADPIERGLITPDHIVAELGDVVAGSHPGRTSDEQITLYKAVGVAVQDAAAVALVLAAARERGAGREVEV